MKGTATRRTPLENEASHHLSGILWHAKEFDTPHKVGTDGLRCPDEWPDVLTITPEFEDFLNRVSICGQFRDSVRSA